MRTYTSILAVAIVLLQATNAAQACGDKVLLVGRGVEFHRAYAALYPASIVIYARLPGDAAKAIRDSRFQASLKQSGQCFDPKGHSSVPGTALARSGATGSGVRRETASGRRKSASALQRSCKRSGRGPLRSLVANPRCKPVSSPPLELEGANDTSFAARDQGEFRPRIQAQIA